MTGDFGLEKQPKTWKVLLVAAPIMFLDQELRGG